jgi:hypothetical protein
VALLLALGIIGACGTSSPSDRFYRQASDPIVSPLPGAAIRYWSFVRGLPNDWAPVGGAQVSQGSSGTVVVTSTPETSYELESPNLQLEAGSYELVVRARITTGGLQLGVLNAATTQWIETSQYSVLQASHQTTDLTLDFNLGAPTTVEFVLSNWSDRPQRSHWLIQGAELRIQRT